MGYLQPVSLPPFGTSVARTDGRLRKSRSVVKAPKAACALWTVHHALKSSRLLTLLRVICLCKHSCSLLTCGVSLTACRCYWYLPIPRAAQPKRREIVFFFFAEKFSKVGTRVPRKLPTNRQRWKLRSRRNAPSSPMRALISFDCLLLRLS